MAKKSDKPNSEPLPSGDMPIEGRPLIAVLEEISAAVRANTTKLDHLEREQEKTNIAVETYQKASGQVVNLAFGLIAIATITIVLSAIVNK